VQSELSSLAERLEAIVGAEHVASGVAHTAAFAVDGILPELVVHPGTQEEVSKVVAACAQAGAAMLPWGGGTAMGLGNAPTRAQVVIRLDRLDRIVEWDPANLVVTAEAGLSLAALQERIARDRAVLPLDPPHAGRVTLGGLVAANQNGPARLLYGTVRDWLLGLRVVLPDGERIHCGGRVIKNVSGYDMNKLFIRSMGTLGIVTEVTFKLLPMPADRAGLIGLFPEPDRAWAVVRAIQASFLLPEAVDLLDPPAVEQLAPVLALPASPGDGALAVALAGSPETVARQARDLTAMIEAEGGTALPLSAAQTGPAWQAIRDLLDEGPARPDRILCKLTVPIARTGDLFGAAGHAGARAGLQTSRVAHAASGVVWARYLPGPASLAGAGLATALEALRAETLAAGGSLVLQDAPPAMKEAMDVWGPPGDGLELMRRLKAELDPRGLCNPGRFAGGI